MNQPDFRLSEMLQIFFFYRLAKHFIKNKNFYLGYKIKQPSNIASIFSADFRFAAFLDCRHFLNVVDVGCWRGPRAWLPAITVFEALEYEHGNRDDFSYNQSNEWEDEIWLLKGNNNQNEDRMQEEREWNHSTSNDCLQEQKKIL